MRFSHVLGIAALGLSATYSQAQPPEAQPRATLPQTPVFPKPVYQLDGVNRNLNLTQQQIDRLNDINNRVQTSFRDRFDKVSTVAENERAARLQELNRQYQTEWMNGAREVFNENQLNRYRQLNYQYGGYQTFSDPDVQKRLNLTEDQQRRLREEIEWNAVQTRKFNEQAQTDREKAQQFYRDYRKQYDERFNKFLTPEQQKAWRELAGEPYEFQPAFMTPQR